MLKLLCHDLIIKEWDLIGDFKWKETKKGSISIALGKISNSKSISMPERVRWWRYFWCPCLKCANGCDLHWYVEAKISVVLLYYLPSRRLILATKIRNRNNNGSFSLKSCTNHDSLEYLTNVNSLSLALLKDGFTNGMEGMNHYSSQVECDTLIQLSF